MITHLAHTYPKLPGKSTNEYCKSIRALQFYHSFLSTSILSRYHHKTKRSPVFPLPEEVGKVPRKHSVMKRTKSIGKQPFGWFSRFIRQFLGRKRERENGFRRKQTRKEMVEGTPISLFVRVFRRRPGRIAGGTVREQTTSNSPTVNLPPPLLLSLPLHLLSPFIALFRFLFLLHLQPLPGGRNGGGLPRGESPRQGRVERHPRLVCPPHEGRRMRVGDNHYSIEGVDDRVSTG